MDVNDSTDVAVNPIPATPIITKIGDTLFSSYTTGNQWYFNGNLMNGAVLNYIVPVSNGNYQVQETDGNGCVSALSDPWVIYVGTDDITANRNLSVYPNPTTGMIYLKGNLLTNSDFDITIVSTFGQPVAQFRNCTSIDLNNLSSGMYQLSIRTKDNTLIRKKIIILK